MSPRWSLSRIRHKICRIFPKPRIACWPKVLAVATSLIPSIIVFSAGSSAERRIARNDGIGNEAVYS